MNSKNLINFLAEVGQLKRVKRSGWWVAGIKTPESVAEHCFRTTVIGYILAKMEKVDPYPVLLITLFHDTQEARLNDLHKVSQRYLNIKDVEEKVLKEQLSLLPEAIKNELSSIFKAYVTQKSKESLIARDADILECMLQAKEYFDFGFTQAKPFIKVEKFLKTKSAKLLAKTIPTWNYRNWWLHLKKFDR